MSTEAKREVWVVEDDAGSPLNAGVWGGDALEFRPQGSVRYVPAVEPLAAEAGKAQAEWVSFQIKPSDGQPVLAYNDVAEQVRVGEYDAEFGDVVFVDGFWHLNESQATHWMPLPPPSSAPEGT